MRLKFLVPAAILVAMLVATAFLPNHMENPTMPAAVSGCQTNSKLCKDNAEFANSMNPVYIYAQTDCEFEASKQAKYGSPDWSWLSSFSKFRQGDSLLTSGTMALIDDTVTFQNRYGAAAHVEVVCTYDFNSKSVRDVYVQWPE